MKFLSFVHADLEHFVSVASVFDISDTLNSRTQGTLGAKHLNEQKKTLMHVIYNCM